MTISTEREDETPAFWMDRTKDQLAGTVAAMHRDRRIVAEGEGYREVMAVRRAVAEAYVSGSGIEVGAGNRPWPLPPDAKCFYGDLFDTDQLRHNFRHTGMLEKIKLDGPINAQTFAGIADSSLDFVLSAHVIEHLPDPIGSIKNAIRVLKPGGVHLLAVPDMSRTFEKVRPPTTLDHLLADERDGGQGTRRQSYEEHVRYIHPVFNTPIPEDEIEGHVARLSAAGADIHWHTWSGDTFREMLDAISDRIGFSVVSQLPIQNEAICVLRKR